MIPTDPLTAAARIVGCPPQLVGGSNAILESACLDWLEHHTKGFDATFKCGNLLGHKSRRGYFISAMCGDDHQICVVEQFSETRTLALARAVLAVAERQPATLPPTKDTPAP